MNSDFVCNTWIVVSVASLVVSASWIIDFMSIVKNIPDSKELNIFNLLQTGRTQLRHSILIYVRNIIIHTIELQKYFKRPKDMFFLLVVIVNHEHSSVKSYCVLVYPTWKKMTKYNIVNMFSFKYVIIYLNEFT